MQPQSDPAPAAEVLAQPPHETALTNPWTWVSVALSLAVLAFLWWIRALRPGCLGKHGRRDLEPLPWWMWFVAAFASYLAPAIGSGIVIATMGAPSNSNRYQAINGLVGYAIGLFVAITLARTLKRMAPAAGLAVKPKHLSLGIPCFLLCMPVMHAASSVSTIVYELITSSQITSNVAHETLEAIVQNPSDHWVWVMIFLATVAAPIQEEVVYRGFLQSGILKATGRPWFSIVITSGIFAVAHLQANVPWYAISTLFVLALALGFAFERSRSIAVPIVMHMLFNAANIVVALLIS